MSPRILDSETHLQRENQILDCALQFIEQHSIAQLTIDKLVKELPFSKGTVYNHFSGKEDLLLALCNRSMRVIADLFSRAVGWDGTPRELGLSIHFAYMLYAKLRPTQFMLVLTAKSSSVTEKASVECHNEHIALEGQLIGPVIKVFQQAFERNEINPPMSLGYEQLAFSCWSMSFGINALLLQDIDQCSARSGLIVEQELINNVNILFDGLQLQPLTRDFDWQNTVKHLKEHVFKKEVAQLAERGQPLRI